MRAKGLVMGHSKGSVTLCMALPFTLKKKYLKAKEEL